MIQHVMERAGQAENVKTVAVATDDERIKEAVESFGGRVIMTPAKMRTGSDRVALAASELGLGPDELVVNVQGDQPLLPPALIDLIAEPMHKELDLDMATPVVAITRPEEINDPNHVKAVMDQKGNALYFSRQAIPFPRDGGEVTYYKHLGVYIYRKSFLDLFQEFESGKLEDVEKLEQLRALEQGATIRLVVSSCDSPEVDRPEDAKRVEELLARMG
jgi:3-deoxy-manno-octulosonate cytidylyltransferase (CMP-KDO synthetase)